MHPYCSKQQLQLNPNEFSSYMTDVSPEFHKQDSVIGGRRWTEGVCADKLNEMHPQ